MQAVETIEYSASSRLTRKGQVTIPVYIRRLLGLSPQDRVAFRVVGDRVELTPAQSIAERTARALRQYSHGPAPSPQEEAAAFERAVADEVAASLDR
jgi:AbrB family looped-hinge helix DNA binding protein